MRKQKNKPSADLLEILQPRDTHRGKKAHNQK